MAYSPLHKYRREYCKICQNVTQIAKPPAVTDGTYINVILIETILILFLTLEIVHLSHW